MAKNATLAYPFDHASGKLGTDQNLKYAENDNPAWDAPDGRQYAKNYKPVMVLNYNPATGKQSFQIKTKSATFMSPATRLQMAVSGGANAVIATIIALRMSATSALATIYSHFLNMQGSGIIPQDMTYRKYLTDVIYKGVKAKASVFTFASPQGQVIVNNPWVGGGAGVDVQIQSATLLKFAPYLCNAVVVVDDKVIGGIPSVINDSDGSHDTTWAELKSNGNFGAQFQDFGTRTETIEEVEETIVTFKGSDLYKIGGARVMAEDTLVSGINAATTTAPNA